ncbi:MAG: hypothetical protein DRQ51_05280 [Gammaproteobacteria bacterium]|nr:MAG: hypothetical protein DRQ51_05280 [Gammaproteobacteria bacterium]
MNTNIIKKSYLLLPMLFVAINPSFAKDRPIQLQVMTSTVGTGIHGGYHINDKFYVGLDHTSYDTKIDDDSSNSSVEVKLKFNTNILLARYAPFGNVFYLQAGLVNRSWDVDAVGTEEIGDSGVVARVDANVSFPSTALNVGVGWNWIAKFGLSGGFGVGIINGGAPEVDLSVNNNTISDADIKKEEDEFEDDLSAFSTFPYLHGFIGYNF